MSKCSPQCTCARAATARSRRSQYTSVASAFPHRLASGRAAFTCTSRHSISAACPRCPTVCAGACERSTALGPAPQNGSRRCAHCKWECVISMQCDCVRRVPRERKCNSRASQARARPTTSRRCCRKHRIEQQRSHNPSRVLLRGRVARSRSSNEFWADAHSHIAREFVSSIGMGCSDSK